MESEQSTPAVMRSEIPSIDQADAKPTHSSPFAKLPDTIKGHFKAVTDPILNKIRGITSWFENKFKNLTFAQYCYFFGFAMFIAFILDDQQDQDLALVIGIIGGIGLAKEMWSVFNRVWSHTLGKGFLFVLYVATANFALAVSALKINMIAGVEPQIFVFTMGFTTLLMLPFWLLVASFIFLGTSLVLLNLWLAFRLLFRIFGIRLKVYWEDQSFAVVTIILRTFFIPFVIYVLGHLIQPYLKQMDMFEPIQEIALFQQLDPFMIINSEKFTGASKEELEALMAMIQRSEEEELSQHEREFIQQFALSDLHIETIRNLDNEEMERFVSSITAAVQQKSNQLTFDPNGEETDFVNKFGLPVEFEESSDAATATDKEEQQATEISSELASNNAATPAYPVNPSEQEITQQQNTGDTESKAESAHTPGTADTAGVDASGDSQDNTESEESAQSDVEENTQVLNRMIANFIYLFETYTYSACKKEPHQRVMLFNEDMLFVAEKDLEQDIGYRFFVRECEPNYGMND